MTLERVDFTPEFEEKPSKKGSLERVDFEPEFPGPTIGERLAAAGQAVKGAAGAVGEAAEGAGDYLEGLLSGAAEGIRGAKDSKLAVLPYLIARGGEGAAGVLESLLPFSPTVREWGKLAREAGEFWGERAAKGPTVLDILIGYQPGPDKGLYRGMFPDAPEMAEAAYENARRKSGVQVVPAERSLVEMLGDVASGAGFVGAAGPVFRGAGLVGEAAKGAAVSGTDTALGALARAAGSLPGQALIRGTTAGTILSGGEPTEAAVNSALFTVFEGLGLAIPKVQQLPEKVAASTWWRMKTIPERALVVQSLDKVVRGLQAKGYTEGQILREIGRIYGRSSPEFRQMWDEALGKRARPEGPSEEPPAAAAARPEPPPQEPPSPAGAAAKPKPGVPPEPAPAAASTPTPEGPEAPPGLTDFSKTIATVDPQGNVLTVVGPDALETWGVETFAAQVQDDVESDCALVDYEGNILATAGAWSGRPEGVKDALKRHEVKQQADVLRRREVMEAFGQAKFSKGKVPKVFGEGEAQQRFQMPAQLYGGLAVVNAHRLRDGKLVKGKGYQILHAASGLHTTLNYDTADEAKLAAWRLARITDWRQPAEELQKQEPYLRQVIERLKADPLAELPEPVVAVAPQQPGESLEDYAQRVHEQAPPVSQEVQAERAKESAAEVPTVAAAEGGVSGRAIQPAPEAAADVEPVAEEPEFAEGAAGGPTESAGEPAQPPTVSGQPEAEEGKAPPQRHEAGQELTDEQAEALIDEWNSLLQKLPRDIGKAKREGRWSGRQQKLLDRVNEIEAILPQTSEQWQRIVKRKNEEWAAARAKEAEKRAAEEVAAVAERGLSLGDEVQITSVHPLNPTVALTTKGIVRQGKDGGVYVLATSGEQKGKQLSIDEPWKKVERPASEEPPTAPPGSEANPLNVADEFDYKGRRYRIRSIEGAAVRADDLSGPYPVGRVWAYFENETGLKLVSPKEEKEPAGQGPTEEWLRQAYEANRGMWEALEGNSGRPFTRIPSFEQFVEGIRTRAHDWSASDVMRDLFNRLNPAPGTTPEPVPVPGAVSPTKKPAKKKPGRDAKMERIREFYTPGNIIKSGYWGTYDKVLDFIEDERGWRVRVQEVDEASNPKGDVREHFTPPGPRDQIVRRAEPAQLTPETPLEEPVQPPGQKPPPKGTISVPAVTPARALADKVKAHLRSPEAKLDWKQLFAYATEAYGGTQAQGKFTPKDAYDGLEMGLNEYIAEMGLASPAPDTAWAEAKVKALQGLLERLPTQTKRTLEQEKFQQFSTPPPLAYLVNWLANIGPRDTVLEPSAGVGGLAVFARAAGARTIVNELEPRRRALLEQMGFDEVHGEDAEQIGKILHGKVKPTVVVMNPPFSQTGGRMGNKRQIFTGARHIEEALELLEPGGRLVAVVGRGMAEDKPAFIGWWSRLKRVYTVHANVGLSGEGYRKFGTTFDNRVVVIDKTGPTLAAPVTGEFKSPVEALAALEGVRDARTHPSQPEQAQPGRQEVPAAGEKRPAPARPLRPPTDEVVPGAGGAGGRPPSGRDRGAPPAGGAAGPGDYGPPRDERGGRPPEPPAQAPVPGQPRVAAPGQPGEPHGGAPAELPAAQEIEATQALHKGELTEAIFEPYQPSRLNIPGWHKHPTPLVESAAMAAVSPPAPTYRPHLPQEVITSGKLSDIQLEAVVYAGQAHEQMLENGQRRGFFIGDGTGVGKGREIAGVIWDNWQQGRRKHVWVSKDNELLSSAQRDVAGAGWDPKLIFPLIKTRKGTPISQPEGILFTSYDLLREPERLKQIKEWLGDDFDGVLAFDEAHHMGNAIDRKGLFGVRRAAAKALAAIDLQNQLPNARVLYVSATGATEVDNLSYAGRLGLWGPGTAFSSREQFINQISTGGVGAMEVVARDLKAQGGYLARNLAFNVPGDPLQSVHYDRIEHALTEKQVQIYNDLAEAWQLVLRNIEEILPLLAGDAQGRVDGRARAKAMSRFWGAELRFFNSVVTSLQMPTVLADAKRALDAGNAVLFQLVNTDEAAQKRALSRIENEQDLEDLDLTPREQLLEFVRVGFPTQQYEEYLDDNGNARMRPVVDAAGNAVENPAAVRLRDSLLEKLAAIRVPKGPIDQIVEFFGPKNVAEVTGRSRRVVQVTDEKGTRNVVENRSKKKGMAEAQEFMDDKRRVLIFSDAGGTGQTYNASLEAKNQRRRIHYLVQPGWRADNALQGLGRSHRSNQASAPVYKLCTTSLKGQKRFLSSIARRLDQLGALTKGQRQTGSQGIFQARDNLESKYAHDAMMDLFRDIVANEVPGVSLGEFQHETGLNLLDKDGNVKSNAELSIQRFLNRLLSLTVERQNKVFDEFSRRMDARIQAAAERGELDVGMETLRALTTEKVKEQVVHTDERTGSETKYVELRLTQPNVRLSFEQAMQSLAHLGEAPEFYRNKRSNRVWAVSRRVSQHTDYDTGEVFDARSAKSAATTAQRLAVEDLGNEEKWELLDPAQAAELWKADYERIGPTHTTRAHLITGALLPIWDRLSQGTARIMRVQTDRGERMIGRLIPPEALGATLERLGAERAGLEQPTGREALNLVLNQGARLELANGWWLDRRQVSGDERVELHGLDYYDARELERRGLFGERIDYRTRYFVPTTDEGAALLDYLIRGKTVVNVRLPETAAGETIEAALKRARKEEGDVTLGFFLGGAGPAWRKTLEDFTKLTSPLMRLFSGGLPHPDLFKEVARLRKRYAPDLTKSDVTWLAKHQSLPYWLAKRSKSFRRLYNVEDIREAFSHNRGEELIGLTTPMQQAKWTLSRQQYQKLVEAIWHYDEVRETPTREDLAAFGLEEAAIDAYKSARQSLGYVWYKLLPDLFREMGATENEIEEYRRSVGNVAGYWPHMRKGRWAVTVSQGDEFGEEVLWREHFDDIVATLTGGRFSPKAGWKLRRLERQFPGARVSVGKVRRLQAEQFFQVSADAMDAIINAAVPEADVPEEVSREALAQALKKAVAEQFMQKGFMRHGLERKGVPGFDRTDPLKALNEYLIGFAGFEATVKAARAFHENLAKIDPKTDLYSYSAAYVQDMLSAGTELDRVVDKVRGALFMHFLGASLKSAVVQLTQNFVTGWPVLSLHTKWALPKILAEMVKAGADRLYDLGAGPLRVAGVPVPKAKELRLTQEERIGLAQARKKGVIDDSLTQELLGDVSHLGRAGRYYSRIMRFFFGNAEIFNRETLYITAHRVATKERRLEGREARRFAEDRVLEAHFAYGKKNLPPFSRGGRFGKMFRAAYTFRSFNHNLLSLYAHLAGRKDKKGMAALGRSFLALLALGGIGAAIPFYKSLEQLVQWLSGRNIRSEIAERTDENTRLLLFYGLPGVVGVDLTGSLTLEAPTTLEDIPGVATELVRRPYLAGQDIRRGDYYRALEDVAPVWAGNIMKAHRLGTEGLTTRGGQQILAPDTLDPVVLTSGEQFRQGLGFQNIRTSEHYRRHEAFQRGQDYWMDRRDALLDKYHRLGVRYGYGSAQALDVVDEMVEFNEAAPVWVTPITPDTLTSRQKGPGRREFFGQEAYQ